MFNNKAKLIIVNLFIIFFGIVGVVSAAGLISQAAGYPFLLQDSGGFLSKYSGIIQAVLGALSGLFGWFFMNLKNALKETADVITQITGTVKEAVDVVDAFVNIIQIDDSGTVTIPPDGFAKVKKEVAEVKTALGLIKKEMAEMASAWGNLLKRQKKEGS